jgi:predicted nucleic acid-binding protein
MIVLDTNATIKLLLERNNRLEDLASSTELIAPEFMKIEVYNVLRGLLKTLFLLQKTTMANYCVECKKMSSM